MHTKIVFSGGPGVGKTTILNELRRRKLVVMPEVFTVIFRPAAEQGRLEELLEDGKALLEQLIAKQREQEAATNADATLYDRGMIDIGVFAENEGYELTTDQRRAIEESSYDAIVIVEPLPEHLYDRNKVRRQSYETALHDHHKVCEAYERHVRKSQKGCVLRIPPLIDEGPKKRADLTLSKISALSLL